MNFLKPSAASKMVSASLPTTRQRTRIVATNAFLSDAMQYAGHVVVPGIRRQAALNAFVKRS